MKKLLLTAAAALTTVMAVSAANVEFSYAQPTTTWGSNKAETYDVAIGLTNPVFAGKKIVSINVPVPCGADISDFSIWLTSELKVKLVDGFNVNDPDMYSVDMAMPAATEAGPDGWAIVTAYLPEPVEVPAKGFYAGYTLTVTKLGTNAFDRRPIVVGSASVTDGLWVRANRSYVSWSKMSERLGYASAMSVNFEGEFYTYAATAGNLTEYYGVTAAPGSVEGVVTNTGAVPVTSVEYVSTVGDQSFTGTITFDEPITGLLTTAPAVFATPANSVEGPCEVTVKITKVNGQVNEDNAAAAVGKGAIADAWRFRRPLMEEYTGTGCGYCPRGFVAMDYMMENYGDTFCGVAWHTYNGTDPMYTTKSPSQATSFPAMFVDRGPNRIDPYYGAGNGNSFGLEDTWLALHEEFSDIDISVKAEFDANNPDKINVTSKLNVVNPLASGTYYVEFIYLGDDVHPNYNDPTINTSAWAQSNGYNSNQYATMYLMTPFVGAGSYAKNLVYNMVGFDRVSAKEGNADVTPGVEQTFTQTFSCAKILNGKGASIPFNRDKLHVIAALVKKNTGVGTIIDSAQCTVGAASGAGIEDSVISTSTAVVASEWFDLSGRRAAVEPVKGLWIRADRMADGSTRTSKVVL